MSGRAPHGVRPVTAREQREGKDPYRKEGETHPMGDPLHPARAPALREAPEVSTVDPATHGVRLGVPPGRREKAPGEHERAGRNPGRAERTAARRREFHLQRIAEAESAADRLSAGSSYLAAVIKEMSAVDPQRADEVTREVVDYMLNQTRRAKGEER